MGGWVWIGLGQLLNCLFCRYVGFERAGEGANEPGEGSARTTVLHFESLPGDAGQVRGAAAEDTRTAENVSGGLEESWIIPDF